jgi:ATP-dependent Lhr-like helicase
VTLLPRRSASVWMRAAPTRSEQPAPLSSRAQDVFEQLRQHGASFFDEIVESTGMLRTQIEDALGELVAFGLVSSDSFAGLRALLTPSEKRKPLGGRKRHRRSLFGIEDSGRWALQKRSAAVASGGGYREGDVETVEHVVGVLLRRYGVLFWRLLMREAAWLPPWREMLRVLRRLEARGDLRGGRFVAGVSGEQFALPEAVGALREARRASQSGTLIAVSAADPLNLVGILVPGPRIPSLASNRVLYRDGVPIAALIGGQVQALSELTISELRAAEDALIKRQADSPLLAYLR